MQLRIDPDAEKALRDFLQKWQPIMAPSIGKLASRAIVHGLPEMEKQLSVVAATLKKKSK